LLKKFIFLHGTMGKKMQNTERSILFAPPVRSSNFIVLHHNVNYNGSFSLIKQKLINKSTNYSLSISNTCNLITFFATILDKIDCSQTKRENTKLQSVVLHSYSNCTSLYFIVLQLYFSCTPNFFWSRWNIAFSRLPHIHCINYSTKIFYTILYNYCLLNFPLLLA